MKKEADIKIFTPHSPDGSGMPAAFDPVLHETEESLHIWKPACPVHREAAETAKIFGIGFRI